MYLVDESGRRRLGHCCGHCGFVCFVREAISVEAVVLV